MSVSTQILRCVFQRYKYASGKLCAETHTQRSCTHIHTHRFYTHAHTYTHRNDSPFLNTHTHTQLHTLTLPTFHKKFHTHTLPHNVHTYTSTHKHFYIHTHIYKHIYMQRRDINVRDRINWMKIKKLARIDMYHRKKLKRKTHKNALQRFRLTKFGWERLRAGRNNSEKWKNASWKKKKRLKSITYVHRHDLKKFRHTSPFHRLKIRDPPIDRNINITKTRKFLPSHFG